MPQNIINLENISYTYLGQKKPVLENINLTVGQGEFLAVMGKTGAGKTTLCRLLNGIIPHSTGGHLQGVVFIDGERTDISSVSFLALKVGMVLDDPDAQLFTASARHEAAFGPENLLLSPHEIIERVSFALDAVGLAGFEDRQPSSLSGGEKQRLAIAAALAMKGKILVLDEPLTRLDPQGKIEVMSVLKKLKEKHNLTIIMADHNSSMMAEFADRVCILNNGRITAAGMVKKIFSGETLLSENGIQPPEAADIFSIFHESEELQNINKETPAIKISCFSHSYGQSKAIIENINLSIADNDFIALIGHNGCGKTTLLKNIAGLLCPSSGDIYIRGNNTKTLTVSAISKEIGFIMQNPDSQLFTSSVYDEVAFALKNSGLSKAEIHCRVTNALQIAGLENPAAFPHALCRAGRTKTVLAAVLAMGCKILVLDEVDVGQDYEGSVKIMEIAKELHSKGITIIFVTHNMSLVCKYAHRLILMDRKGIVKDMRRKGSDDK
jgi:energy-coupling factor transport system ATP-binding protein